MMNQNQIKTMKFIAGQVWLLQIVTEQLDGAKTKFRPYLVIAANNRRLTLLRVTHGGKLATNWLEPFGVDKHGEEQNIILDAPISVQTRWIQRDQYLYQLDADDFRYIMRKHTAAMLYQSIPNFLNDEDVAAIKEIIANHTDGMYAFGKYMPIAGMASVDEDDDEYDESDDITDTEDDEDVSVPEKISPERISMVIESDDALSELREKIRYADPDDAVALTAEYRKAAAAAVNTPIVRNPDNVPRRVSLDAGLKGVSVNDIVIPGGSTKYEDIKAYAEALKISGQKFKFGFDDIRRNGITYENQRCSCTLKRDVNTSKSSKYHMIPEEMYDTLYLDACKFGIKATAAIWKCSETTVRRICNIVE